MHQFHIYGKDYGISYLGGIAFSDNANQVFLDNFDFDSGDKFTYEYNFFKNWTIDTRIENIKKLPSKSSIYCTKGNGMPGVRRHDEARPILNLLKVIVNADKTTTFGDIRPLVDAVNAVRFNQRLINNRLKSEVV